MAPAATSHGQRRSSRGLGTAHKLAYRAWLGRAVTGYTRRVRPAIHPTPLRAFCRRPLAAALLGCLALCGCQEVDSSELIRIRGQQATGDYTGSIEPLLELLKTQPDDAETNYLYGRALAMTQQPSLATWSLRKAMQDPEWLLPAGRELAFAALTTSDFNEVVEATGRILEREPEDVPALLMRAQAHAYWRKEPEKALEDANRVLEISPDTLEAFEPRILALLALGRQEEASEALAEAGRRMASFDVPGQRYFRGELVATPNVLLSADFLREYVFDPDGLLVCGVIIIAEFGSVHQLPVEKIVPFEISIQCVDQLIHRYGLFFENTFLDGSEGISHIRAANDGDEGAEIVSGAAGFTADSLFDAIIDHR